MKNFDDRKETKLYITDKAESKDVSLKKCKFIPDIQVYVDVEYGNLKIFVDGRNFDNVKEE